MALKLQISSSRRYFKKRLGQANHFLITILVGLDGIIKDDITLSPEFSTSWNPKNKENSAKRSAKFALNSALAWAIDNLDAYFIMCHQKPTLFEDQTLIDDMSKAGRHVHDKFIAIYRYLERKGAESIKPYAALVGLAIQWRNNTTHFGAENKLDTKVLDGLKHNNVWYKDNFRGLDIIESLNSFDDNKDPSFKEVTSMIAAIHKFVEIADEVFVKNIDVNRYIKDIFSKHNNLHLKHRILFSTLTPERKISLMRTMLLSNGFSEVEDADSIIITEDLIKELSL
ncbi:hypothetical protein [Parabacteroides goldsteinii]|uniref:hypothetical protein n=1 Tax=Parabacteroides goldsteinii TaxID=328812 RepID=UPI0034A36696